MNSTEVRIHGTYPLDSSEWGVLKTITPEEAVELTGAEMQPRHPMGGVYLWLNKGFVVIGHKDPGVDVLSAGMLEERFGSVRREWPKGTRAVYLADGRYLLIEKN